MQNQVKILEATYKEHGLNETVRRLTKIYGIDLGNEKVNKLDFINNQIIFRTKNPIIITFEDEYYTITRIYSNYKTINYYDDNKNLFRKTVMFDDKDDEILALDSFCAEQLDSMRILKTTKDDRELLEPYFEREYASIGNALIDEKCKYTEFSNQDTERTKEIDLVDNYYYYNLTCIDEPNRFLETAACLDTPKRRIYGRTTNHKDLLYYAEQAEYPTIQFRGNTVDEHNSTTSYFDIVVTKLPEDGIMSLQIDLVDQLDGSSFHYNHLLTSLSNGPISIKDIVILTFFLEKIDYPFSGHLIGSLNQLKEKMLIKAGKKLPEYDAIELTMRMIPDFNEQAFNMFEHLESYNSIINELSHREMSETQGKTMA